MSERVARSRELVARGCPVATVTRVLQVSRQAVYRTPAPRTPPQRRPATDPVEAAIVEVAQANQTDGYRMVAALTRQKLGRPVNRKRVLRVLRERKLIQRRRPLNRRKRPGFFIVTRPRQLWQLDMDLDLGGRARLVLPERDHRLLHPPDRRLGVDPALSRRRSDHGHRQGSQGVRDPARRVDARQR